MARAKTRINSVISVETVAMLHKYWTTKNGYHSGNLSRLVSTSLDTLVNLLMQAQQVEPFKDQISARNYLIEQGMTTKTMLVHGQKSMIKSLQEESLAEPGSSPSYETRLRSLKQAPTPVDTTGVNAKGVDAIFESIEEEIKKAGVNADEDMTKAMEEAKALLPKKEGENKDVETNDGGTDSGT